MLYRDSFFEWSGYVQKMNPNRWSFSKGGIPYNNKK